MMLDRCQVCGQNATRFENHHFPIPKALGGTETLSLCITCHDMIDRQSLELWPAEWSIRLVSGDLPGELKLLALKLMKLIYATEILTQQKTPLVKEG